MIDAVALKLSPELWAALLGHNLDEGINDAIESTHRDEETGERYLYVESDMASDWCESWLSRDALAAYLETDEIHEHELPEFCADPLVRDFVQTILKVYRLTASV